jgi:GT2 family glycosyltransferase
VNAAPLVRAVVVNYEGGDLTLACLRSLRASTWPGASLEIVMVDNASHDSVADEVERELSDVRVIRSTTNRGFAGGCNLGMADLGETAYVALVNNDATVEPGWLEPLVATLQDDPALGGACPKILLAGRYRDITLTNPTTRRGGRDVGVRVSGARVDGIDVWARTQFVRGFWGLEPDGPGQWTMANAQLWLPDGSRAELLLDTGDEPTWHDVPFTGPAVTVINNVGSLLTTDQHGADRGYLEPDDGRFDTPEDVFAWCGAGVLLRREYLDEVGELDERLFVYAEDLELSWRGQQRGWRYRYVPTSVVHHVHAATTVEGSKLKLYHDERNRLLVLTRHARAGHAWRAIGRHLLVTASYARRDILGRIIRGQRPRGTIVWQRLRAFGAFSIRAPGMLRSRRRDRKAPRQP